MYTPINEGLTSVILLQSFTVFPEYFISISALYVLIVVVIVTYNVYGLLIHKALSECLALILLMACYLIFNDYDVLVSNSNSFHNSIINDYLTYLSKLLICLFTVFYFVLISSSLKEQKLTSFEYLLTILLSTLGLLLMCSSGDLLTAYLSIELSSLAFYILAAFRKTSTYSIESGLKYFIIGSVSSGFFLLGSSFLYLNSGSIYFDDFLTLFERNDWNYYPPSYIFKEDMGDGYYVLISLYKLLKLEHTIWAPWPDADGFPLIDYSFIEIGLAFIFFSLMIKIACAPFHLWSLDVYEGSPTSSSFFFAAITKLSIFVLLIRLSHTCFVISSTNWHLYFTFIGVLSVFVGSFGGLKQRKLKTLLAYSSITNMGYALVALGTFSNTAIQMLFFHLIIYMISGLCTWSIILLLRLKTKKNDSKYSKELGDIALLRKSNPAIAFALSLTMFSIAGIPPLIGFLPKMFIFLSALMMGYYIVIVSSAVLSVIATFYYIRIIKVVYFENLLVGKLYYPINSTNTLLISCLIFSLLFLFFNPTLIQLLFFDILQTPSNITYYCQTKL
jgi:NADH-quinone oxidoreductase subunit N